MKTKRLTIREGKNLRIYIYPSFHASGSIKGMKKQFYGENALLVRCGSYIYNVPPHIYHAAH